MVEEVWHDVKAKPCRRVPTYAGEQVGDTAYFPAEDELRGEPGISSE